MNGLTTSFDRRHRRSTGAYCATGKTSNPLLDAFYEHGQQPRQLGLKPGDQPVLLALDRRCSERGEWVKLSLSELERETWQSRETLKRRTKRLKGLGAILVRRDPGKKNAYNLDPFWEQLANFQPESDHPTGVNLSLVEEVEAPAVEAFSSEHLPEFNGAKTGAPGLPERCVCERPNRATNEDGEPYCYDCGHLLDREQSRGRGDVTLRRPPTASTVAA
jgi:hypothetical protein